MQKDRKEQIIIKALELYLIYGYSNVSISDLQYHLDIGRGTMYYYFKNKDELFTCVMNRFFLLPKKHFLDLPETILVPDMISALLSYFKSLEDVLLNFENKNVNVSNVVTLMFTAYNRFPNLYREANRLYEKELSLWKKALANSIRTGLVREDIPIDTVASMFTHIKEGYDAARTGITMDFSIFPKQYNYLYELIKK